MYKGQAFDLQGGETIRVLPPEGQSKSYPKGCNPICYTFPYIESYEWTGSSTIEMVSYIAEVESYDEKKGGHTYYRISPKQLWQYDLESREYTFLRELEEGNE